MPTKPAELVIPPDLAKAFEVKELNAPAPEATPDAKLTKKDKKKDKKKKAEAKGEPALQPIAGPGTARFVIPDRRPNPDPIRVGEKILMDVTWLGTKAGEFTLEVLPFKELDGRKVYDLKGTARTSELFSLIYKAEDWVESFVDYQGWFPYRFTLHGDETKHIRNNLELFDHGAKKQYVHVHDNRIQKNEVFEEKGYKDLTPFSQDSLSALYYVRTQQMAEGAVITFPMTTNGSQFDTIATVVKIEDVDTKMGYIKAYKTKVETRFKGVLQQQGDAFMWFTADEFRYPVRFEAKVRIGWVAGVAKKIEPGQPEPVATPTPTPTPDATPAPKGVKSKKGKKTVEVLPPVPPLSDDPRISGIEKAPAYTSPPEPPAKKRTWFRALIESIKGGSRVSRSVEAKSSTLRTGGPGVDRPSSDE